MGTEQQSDEYIYSVTIGERKPHRAPVELAEYDPEWPEVYRREEEKIRARSASGRCASSTSARRRCRGSPPSP